MIRSMTGYGRAEVLRGGRKITVEIKSLNHRYLEVAVRLPSALTALELEIRRKVGERFVRGRVEVTIRVDGQADAENGSLRVNWPAVQAYRRLLEDIREKLGVEGPVTLEMIASFRDAFTREDDADAWTEAGEAVAEAVEGAVASTLEMREREGEILCRDLKARIELLSGWLEGIAARGPILVLEYQKRLSERVRELAGGIITDEARLVQEVAILAEKTDITEEIVRFRGHMDQFLEMLKAGEAVGRKIDFLIQEMNREANTIGSKSGDSEIARQVIEIKTELAKIREQVQNIE
jgi:uncharacterized protein (TIGR00255 family)